MREGNVRFGGVFRAVGDLVVQVDEGAFNFGEAFELELELFFFFPEAFASALTSTLTASNFGSRSVLICFFEDLLSTPGRVG